MNALAESVVAALEFLQLADAENVPPEIAGEAMDRIAAHLENCSADERKAIESIVNREYHSHNEKGSAEEVIDFYENFMETYFGGDDESNE